MCGLSVTAQEKTDDAGSPTFVPTVKVSKVLVGGDSLQYMEFSNVYVYPQLTFSSKRQQQSYMRLVKNVKITLPLAKEVRQILIETAEYLETLPNDKAKEAHIKRVEQSILKEYKQKQELDLLYETKKKKAEIEAEIEKEKQIAKFNKTSQGNVRTGNGRTRTTDQNGNHPGENNWEEWDKNH